MLWESLFFETHPPIPDKLYRFPLLRVSLFVGYPALALERMLLFYRSAVYRLELLMATEPKSSPSRPKQARFVFRPYRRVPLWRSLYYLSQECVGKGVATNLSQLGMRIQGEHQVEPGLILALRLTLADDGPTVEIEQATVRWVDGYDFGLDFVRISPVAAKHIAHLLNRQIRVSPLSN